MFFARRHGPWLSAAFVGITLLAAGIFTLVEGLNVRDEIHDQLVEEQITTTADSSIPGVLVSNAATARAQANAIKGHTLGTWGPFSELPSDDDRRVAFIDGVALRTALNLAVVGFGVTDIVIGVSVILIIAATATLVLATPALYFLAGSVVPRPPDSPA